MRVTAGRSELMIRQRVAALTRMLPAARAGDVTAVHHARVATRRLREAMPVVARGRSMAKPRRLVRRLTRALGPVRELDVALMTLDEFAASRDVPRGGVMALRQVIGQERTQVKAHMDRCIDELNVDKLTHRLVSSGRKQDRLAGSPRSVDPRQLETAQTRAARRAARLAAAIDNAAAIYLPDRLHAVRVAVKKLRYALEIVKELSGSRAMARIQTLKRAQDLLGRIHDLEVLIARTRAIQGSANAPTLRRSAEMDILVRRLETECRQLHGRYIAMRGALIAICEYAADVRPRSVRAA